MGAGATAVDARRLAEQQQQPTLEQRVLQHQQRVEARRLEEQRQQLALEQQRLDEAGRLEQRTVPHTYTYSVGPPAWRSNAGCWSHSNDGSRLAAQER